MTEYSDTVERQRLRINSEKWGKGITTLHAHSLTSMWYDTRKTDGSVIDTEYNNGSIKRVIQNTGEIIYFGKALTGDALMDAYGSHGQ